MNKKSFIVFGICFAFLQSLFSQINVISPVAGNWSNKQVLLIETDNSEKADYFYSIDGSSPKEFGFAYDGPVLLDVVGDVELKIVKVINDVTEETKVNYNVVENDGFNSSYENLINSFFKSGILNCSSGSIISIPVSLMYRFGTDKKTFIQGKDLELAKNSSISRYIPCELYDSSNDFHWRFIVNTIPQTMGIYSKKDVPFFVTDWETITFTNQDYIYKIDNGMWTLPKEPITLDRNENHMIYWQSIAFEQGNPIEYFELPKKPTLNVDISPDGNYTYTLIGHDSYTLGVKDEKNSEVQQLFTEIGVDTFFGDKISGEICLQVYSNSIYQGEFTESYVVDKLLPEQPIIISNENAFYSRKKVDITINSVNNADLYVSISKPFVISDVTKSYTAQDSIFENIEFDEYKKVPNDYKISFTPKSEQVEYYKICAYSYNGKSKSLVSEYSVIIDMYNFYFDSESVVENPDGTKLKPYSSFEQCLSDLGKTRFAILKVKGKLRFPEKKTIIQTNCKIQNTGDAQLIFPSNSTLIVKNSTLEIEDCVLKNEEANDGFSNQIIPVLKFENGVFTLSDCELISSFKKNGTFIESYNSSLNFNKMIASTRANSYISMISGVKTRLNIKDSTFASDAETAILFSLNDSFVDCSKSLLKVSGKRGRIGEFFGVEGSIKKNTIHCDFDLNNASVSTFYFDKNSTIELLDNEIFK